MDGDVILKKKSFGKNFYKQAYVEKKNHVLKYNNTESMKIT